MQYAGNGGRFKISDNEITETLLMEPRISALFLFQHGGHLRPWINCFNAYLRERERGAINELILIAAFILDFLSIHPFSDGNGRMARLLTLLLLYQCGYEVGRYISLEKVVEETKEQYYETLVQSSVGWHEGNMTYCHGSTTS